MPRFATLAAAGALTLTLTLAVVASVPAWADDAPVRGSDECTVLVDGAPAVTAAATLLDNAKGLLDLLPATATLEDRTQATEAVNQADAALVAARAAAELELCVDLPVDITDPEPTPDTPEPTTTTPAPVDAVEARIARIRVLIAAIECGPEFNARNGAVQDATFDALPSLSAEQQGELADEYNARLRAINFCADAGSTTPTTTTPVTVDPLADDGSTANVSGNQVTVVPQGSAQTGAL